VISRVAIGGFAMEGLHAQRKAPVYFVAGRNCKNKTWTINRISEVLAEIRLFKVESFIVTYVYIADRLFACVLGSRLFI
jgi:hypothetical protein